MAMRSDNLFKNAVRMVQAANSLRSKHGMSNPGAAGKVEVRIVTSSADREKASTKFFILPAGPGQSVRKPLYDGA